MVHWPEVFFTYDKKSKTLFSADAFGRFGKDDDSLWENEARRYYFGIVGKYGMQVQKALEKLSNVQASMIIYSMEDKFRQSDIKSMENTLKCLKETEDNEE